jgi:hypothetical protein
MSQTPDEIRTERLRARLVRAIFNVSSFWGVSAEQAAVILASLRDEVGHRRTIGGHPWPDPSHARYDPGTADDELREMAYQGAAAIAGQGITPSQRNVWRWCVEHGGRKRQRVGLRIVQEVLTALSAGAVAASLVRDVQGRSFGSDRKAPT